MGLLSSPCLAKPCVGLAIVCVCVCATKGEFSCVGPSVYFHVNCMYEAEGVVSPILTYCFFGIDLFFADCCETFDICVWQFLI